MNSFVHPRSQIASYTIVIGVYTFYIAVFTLYHDRAGTGIAALAVIPVIGASWYFGTRGGVLMAAFSILANMAVLAAEGHSCKPLFDQPGNLIGTLSLILIGGVIGTLGGVNRERKEAILKLEQYERAQRVHTDFLELLNGITGMALEADCLAATLKILVERIGKLFKADDCFFSLWNEKKGIPVPAAAYGSLGDVYSYIQFEPGERTPTTAAIEAGHPIAIVDLKHSSSIDSKVASIFPSHSMLALPLIVQNRKLGALLLGYNRNRLFNEAETTDAQIAAEQIALVLSKSLLLEEERKQVKQLTVLHDIAIISIEADTEDELISRVTDVIGQNLFPNNFGILLLDEKTEVLHAHPSYRFSSSEEHPMPDISLNEGITGQVARTGKPQRLGNVRSANEYLDVDERTISELCVPIKFKEHVLGVINAESTKWDAFTEEDERLLITLAGQIATAMEQMRVAQAERKWLNQLVRSNDLNFALAQITTHIEKKFSTDDIIQNLGMELNKINLTWIMATYDKESDIFTINYTSMKQKFLEIVENGLKYPLIRYTFSRDKLSSGDIFHPTILSNPVDEIQILFDGTRRQGIAEILTKIEIDSETESLRLPLIFEGNLLGILWIWGKNLTRTDLPIMSIFARQLGVSLERARVFQEVQNLAQTDPLTGLQNRRSIFELGRVEFSRAHDTNHTLCCMLLDLDHFKQVNDIYGHPVGDQVLKEFASRCKSSVREVDLVGRYGGEELIILLPQIGRKAVMQVAERLRASIAAPPFKVSDMEIAVTVSIGVAAKDEHTSLLETLIAHADQAMYIAKHQGRNRVVMSK